MASPGSPGANHPILYREPGTDAVGVWVNRLTIIRINELPMTEPQELIDEMFSYLRNESIIYRHKWRKGDLLIWDNRILQHARGPFDKSLPRTLRHNADCLIRVSFPGPSAGRSPTTPIAWRMKRRFKGGTRPTAANPASRAARIGAISLENSRFKVSVTATSVVLSKRRQFS